MSAALCYTAQELADKLHLGRSTIHSRAEKGDIPCVKIGKGPNAPVRFPKVKIDPWLRQMGMIE